MRFVSIITLTLVLCACHEQPTAVESLTPPVLRATSDWTVAQFTFTDRFYVPCANDGTGEYLTYEYDPGVVEIHTVQSASGTVHETARLLADQSRITMVGETSGDVWLLDPQRMSNNPYHTFVFKDGTVQIQGTASAHHVRESDGERLRVVWQVVTFLYPDGSAKVAHDFIGCPGSGGPYPG